MLLVPIPLLYPMPHAPLQACRAAAAAISPDCPRRTTTPSLGLLDDLQQYWQSLTDLDAAMSDEAEAAYAEICRADGWQCRCEIGSEVAKSVGGSGSLAKGPASSTAALDLRLCFSLDEGYSPPQGQVRLVGSSRFFEPTGFWKVQADADGGEPEQLQWRLQCLDGGLVLGGQTLLPAGPVYFNALYDTTSGLEKGRITVKEDIGSDVGLFRAKGILAEFKIVGVFDVARGRTDV